MKQMSILYYNKNKIEILTSTIIITIMAKIIKIIKLPREKKLIEKQIRTKTKIIIIIIIIIIMIINIIIALIMKKITD